MSDDSQATVVHRGPRPGRSVLARVVWGVLTVVIAFGLALGYALYAQRGLLDRMIRVNDGYVPLTRDLDATMRETATWGRIIGDTDPVVVRQALRAYRTLTPQPTRIDALLVRVQDATTSLSQTAANADEVAFLQNVTTTLATLRAELAPISENADALLLRLEGGDDAIVVQDQTLRQIRQFERRVRDLAQVVEARTRTEVDTIDGTEARIAGQALALGVAAVLLAMIILGVLARALRPVRALTQAATALRSGVWTETDLPAPDDEIGILAHEFRDMARAIIDRDRRLSRQNDELERAYRELLDAQRARVESERLAAIGEMSSRITHELRNPLSSIRLNASMLAEELETDGVPDPDAREMAHAILRQVDRLTRLTEDYLSMARPAPAATEVDLTALARTVADEVRAVMRIPPVSVQVLGPPCVVAGSADALRGLLLNLLQNAVRAAQENEAVAPPTVWISTEVSDTMCRLRVQDSGPNVPVGLRARLFAPFVTSHPQGTGLGLNISQRTAQDHGGELTWEAAPPAPPGEETPPSGASFLLQIPVASSRDSIA